MIVLFKPDKSLLITEKAKIYQKENLADKMFFYIPLTYGDLDLSEFEVILRYVNGGNILCTEPLKPAEENDKDGYTKYVLPITSTLTDIYGNVEFDILISKTDEISGVITSIHSGKASFVVLKWTDFTISTINENVIGRLTELESKVDIIAKALAKLIPEEEQGEDPSEGEPTEGEPTEGEPTDTEPNENPDTSGDAEPSENENPNPSGEPSGDSNDGDEEPTLLRDRLVIPDTHNTGCKGELTKFDATTDGQGVKFYVLSTDNTLGLEFDATKARSCFANLNDGDTITYSNYDFTDYPMFTLTATGSYTSGAEYFRENITLIFENCLFPRMRQSYEFNDGENVHLIFRNCTMPNGSFGNSEYENCLIGNRTMYTKELGIYVAADGINPSNHSIYRNCYIMDLEYETEEQGAGHIDGYQSYPEHDDIHLYNCRFECFDMPYTSFGGWTNCIYWERVNTNSSAEYNTIHGGGYYQTGMNRGDPETTYARNNFISRDYSTACYPSEDAFQMTDEGFATYIDTLLVSSIWEEDGYINIMCSNTEHSEKTLRVVADNGSEYAFTLPSCPTFKSADKALVTRWSDLPLDRTFQISASGVHSIECYEGDVLLRTYTVVRKMPQYSKGFRDITVIPDKYNTGCDESLITATVTAEDRSVLPFEMRNDGVVGWRYMNTKVAEGTHFVVENIRFETPFKTFDTGYAKDIVITFNNCMFTKAVTLDSYPQRLTCHFNNCTMTGISGADFTLSRCYIGSKVSGDAMQLYGNITINDCYVADLNRPNDTGDYTGSPGHVDGIQFRTTTSNSGVPSIGGNVHISNMRFETPTLMIPSGYANGYMNACIFTEYQAEVRDFEIENCYFNGGGYTLYLPVSDTYDVEMTIADSFIGHNRRYGRIYKYNEYYNGGANSAHVNPKLTIDNVVDTPALYVSSVWKENGTIHCIVTNDTGEDRTLVIRTSDGDTTYTIPKCPSYNELAALPDNGGYEIRFADLPFDLDKTVSSDSDYVVCFDNTDGNMTQIRYATFEQEKASKK